MKWDARVNKVLRRAGYQITRPPGHKARRVPLPDRGRMLKAPVIVLSPARSGSTLLRMILDSHSQLYAPPELPLAQLTVRAETTWIRASFRELQLTAQEVNYLLWDRVLADILSRGGKPQLVVKTPANVLVWREIAECWPDARFIFLLRHPASAVASLNASWDKAWHPGETGSMGESAVKALRYMRALEEARNTLTGHTIRYEDLTAEPGAQVRRLCEFLGIGFEPGMLEYGRQGHGRIGAGLGDASAKLKSGKIQSAALPPLGLQPGTEAFPDELLRMCETWGYYVPEAGEFSPDEPAPEPSRGPGPGRGPRSGPDSALSLAKPLDKLEPGELATPGGIAEAAELAEPTGAPAELAPEELAEPAGLAEAAELAEPGELAGELAELTEPGDGPAAAPRPGDS